MAEHATSFVGRGEDLEELSRMLAAARLVTIVGPPGTGKTRLANEHLARAQHGRALSVPIAAAKDSAGAVALLAARSPHGARPSSCSTTSSSSSPAPRTRSACSSRPPRKRSS